MTNEILPPKDRDTEPPTPLDALHRSTLPPFASDARVRDLEDKHAEVMAMLGQILDRVDTLTDRVSSFHEDARKLDERMNKLAARVALLDGKREGTNGNSAMG